MASSLLVVAYAIVVFPHSLYPHSFCSEEASELRLMRFPVLCPKSTNSYIWFPPLKRQDMEEERGSLNQLVTNQEHSSCLSRVGSALGAWGQNKTFRRKQPFHITCLAKQNCGINLSKLPLPSWTSHLSKSFQPWTTSKFWHIFVNKRGFGHSAHLSSLHCQKMTNNVQMQCHMTV